MRYTNTGTHGTGSRGYTLDKGASVARTPTGLARDFVTPEDYGAIGDGTLRLARDVLGVGGIQELQAWGGGIYAWCSDMDISMDALAWQAALYAGYQRVDAATAARYVLNRRLHNRNAHINDVNLNGSTLDFSLVPVEPASSTNLITNGTFTSGAGWVNTNLANPPGAPFVFGGGQASWTDPWSLSYPHSFGGMGQNVILPPGAWTVAATMAGSEGASEGRLGGRLISFGFTPVYVNEGGYSWDHPLAGGVTKFTFDSERLSFDFEVPEGVTYNTWLSFWVYNANWTVQNVAITPYRKNCAIWADGTNYGISEEVDSTWRNGTIIGPGRNSGLRGILYKTFTNSDQRLSLRDMKIRGFSGGHVFSDQAFLNVIEGGGTGECDPCVQFVPYSRNAGENIRFVNHVFYNSGLIFDLNGGGEFFASGVSLDYSRKIVEADRGAQLTLVGEHIELQPARTTMAISGWTGEFTTGETITGGTSAATGTIIDDDSAGTLILSTTATFLVGEVITGGTSGRTATVAGPVQQGDVLFQVRGESKVAVDSQEILIAGFQHFGAQHMIEVRENTSIIMLPPFCYNMQTASGVLARGAGRVMYPRGHWHPGNSLGPELLARNFSMDKFGATGRIAGPATSQDMSFFPPPDEIGFQCGIYTDGLPMARLNTPLFANATADLVTARTAGCGSIRLNTDPAWNAIGALGFAAFYPVTHGQPAYDEYWWSQRSTVAPYVHGPFAVPASISTVAGSNIITITDAINTGIGGVGPTDGWTVTIAGAAGVGGIAAGNINGTRTILSRGLTNTFTVQAGAAATSTVAAGGGAGVTLTYGQTSAFIYNRRFWVALIGYDAAGRPIVGQDTFWGETNFWVPFTAMTGWKRNTMRSWYAGPYQPADPLQERIGDGRPPAWATHACIRIDYNHMRFAGGVPLFVTDFFAN